MNPSGGVLFLKGDDINLLKLVPITLRQANAFVQAYHRHHKPSVGHKFSIGVSDGEKLVGVAICGRPVSRRLDDGLTLEVNRVCTDGTKNACSMLYGASCRAAKAMGYRRVITYILEPVLKPFQRFNLQFAGIDWTVLVVIFLLNFVSGIILNALLLLA